MPGDVIVYTSDVNLVTLSKPVGELPGLIVLIGCRSFPDDAVEYNFTWAHTFKLSKRFYLYTIYWNQRGILGFNNTFRYGDTQILEFVSKALEYAQTEEIGQALIDAGQEKGINVALVYYTGRYTYSREYYAVGGEDTAVYVGDYSLTIDPSLDNEVAEKVVGYIGLKYPVLYDLLSAISDGLVRLKVEDTLLHFPGFGSVTELDMKFDKNITDIGARVIVWVSAYLWKGEIIKFSITTHILPWNHSGADWVRSMARDVVSIINKEVAPMISKAGLRPELINRSKSSKEINLMIVPYIDNMPVYLGASGWAYVSTLVHDHIYENGTGYLAFTFVDNTPYLLKHPVPRGDKFRLSKDDILEALDIKNRNVTIEHVRKGWALLPEGLVPAYIVSYSDGLGGHTRVVDASTGEVLYSSDGGLGTAPGVDALARVPNVSLWVGSGAVAIAAAVGWWLLRKRT